MRWFAYIVLALVVLFMWTFQDYTHRFRLTVEIATPEGIKIGSSVIEVERKDERWAPVPGARFTFQVRGEAVFVDLGSRGHVIALLTHGAQGENSSEMTSLALRAYGYEAPFSGLADAEAAWQGKAVMRGPVELRPPLIPTMVTFTDLADPRSAKVVYATGDHVVSERVDERGTVPRSYGPKVLVDEITATFGAGVRFHRATLEMVDAGTWPFTLLGWPQSLAGVPMTRGIEGRMGWIGNYQLETIFERRLRELGTGGVGSLAPGMKLKRDQ